MIYRTKFYDQAIAHNGHVQTTTVATIDTTSYNLLGVIGYKVATDEINVISWPIRQERVLQGDLRHVLQGPEVEQLTNISNKRDTTAAMLTAFMTTASACQIAAHVIFPALAPMTFGLGCLASVVAGVGQNERSSQAIEERRTILVNVAVAGTQATDTRGFGAFGA